jgi:hypothetical protein
VLVINLVDRIAGDALGANDLSQTGNDLVERQHGIANSLAG